MNPEILVRLTAFTGILITMVIWELMCPRRGRVMRKQRWPSNFAVTLINASMLAVLPITAVEAALYAIFNKVGLLIWFEIPFWPSVILSVCLLDIAIYWQHRLFHRFEFLWRIHRMHHADSAIDVTTGLRFHPFEIVLSILIKAAIIILLGAPVLAVIIFEIVLNGSSMFNHSNLHLPKWVDRCVRCVFVTPDMHRVHHSMRVEEHNRNFGFCLSWWDHLFSSYTDQPQKGHLEMDIGLAQFNATESARLGHMLRQPFR